MDFPGGPVVNNPPASGGDTGSVPGPGRFHMPWATVRHDYWAQVPQRPRFAPTRRKCSNRDEAQPKLNEK